jgi:hypothetical protein
MVASSQWNRPVAILFSQIIPNARAAEPDHGELSIELGGSRVLGLRRRQSNKFKQRHSPFAGEVVAFSVRAIELFERLRRSPGAALWR